jgi:hypothetical protein
MTKSKGFEQLSEGELSTNDVFADDEKKADLKTLTIRLNVEAFKAFKQLALDLDQPMAQLIRGAMNDLLVKNHKAPMND